MHIASNRSQHADAQPQVKSLMLYLTAAKKLDDALAALAHCFEHHRYTYGCKACVKAATT